MAVRGPCRAAARGSTPPEPGDINPPGVHRVIQGTVAAAVLGRQRQPHEGSYRPLGAQHRVGQLEQLITAGGEAAMQLPAEGAEPLACPSPAIVRLWLDSCPGPRHTPGSPGALLHRGPLRTAHARRPRTRPKQAARAAQAVCCTTVFPASRGGCLLRLQVACTRCVRLLRAAPGVSWWTR